MLQNKKRIDQINPAYQYIGKENGQNVFLVNIQENKQVKKKINLDDALLDDLEFPEEYYNSQWKEEKTKDENEFNQIDFYRMDYKESQYYIYRQLVSISSLLLDIKEVLKNEKKS